MPTSHPTGTIRHNVLIPLSSPETIYRAFLSSKEHTEFTGSEAKCSAKVGGRFTAWDKACRGQEDRSGMEDLGMASGLRAVDSENFLEEERRRHPAEHDSVASPSLTSRPIRQGLVRILLGTPQTILPCQGTVEIIHLMNASRSILILGEIDHTLRRNEALIRTTADFFPQ